MSIETNEFALREPLDDPFWSENVAIGMADARSGVSLLLSIGTWYGAPKVWREKLTVVLPDGRRLVARNYGRNTSHNRFSASIAQYEIVEPGRVVRVRFDGPVMAYTLADLLSAGAIGTLAQPISLELSFVASAPMWAMHGGAAHEEDRTGIMGAMHDEQLGRCSGHVEFDGVRHEIRGAHACRDHSRGPRHMGRYRAHAWINGQLEDGRGFQVYHAHLQDQDEPALAKAVIAKEGRLYPVSIEGLSYIGAPEHHGLTHGFTLTGAAGRMDIRVTEVFGTVVTGVVAPFEAFPGVLPGRKHIVILDEAVRIECDGVTGTGFCERGVAPPDWGMVA